MITAKLIAQKKITCMKKIILSLALMISVSSFAGSDNYQCTAYSLDKTTNRISTIEMSRFSIEIDGEELVGRDSNKDLFGSTHLFGDEIHGVGVKVKQKSTVANLNGQMGKRDHSVSVEVVDLEVSSEGVTTKYAGTCTEVQVTTCGGPCND